MPEVLPVVFGILAVILSLFVAVTSTWFLYSLGLYVRGWICYQRHRRRLRRKTKHRQADEAQRSWKKNHESDWVNYQFHLQTALAQAEKLPRAWTPDLPTPPCSPPPSVTPLSLGDQEWDDREPWIPPPNFCRYWCSRNPKFESQREAFDEQHQFRHKTMEEYVEWKRKSDEHVQEAIRNHPIANTFLQLSKTVNEYSVSPTNK